MLLIECGSVWTHASLLGMAEGHCRLLARADAPTTGMPPLADVTIGIRNVLTQLEYITGRRLFFQGAILSPEVDTGDGVDGVALLTSVGGPLRIMVAGPGLDVWGASLRRAFASLATEIILPPGVNPDAYPLFRGSGYSPSATPHVVLLLGPGPDAIASPEARDALERAAQSVNALLATEPGVRTGPMLLFLGSMEEQAIIRRHLAGRDIVAIEPPPPAQAGQLAPVLAQIYEHTNLTPLPAYHYARAWVSAPPLSATTGLGRVVRFLSQRYNMNVLAVNVGASSTLAVGATAQGNLFVTQAHQLGVRQGAGALARRAGLGAIARWLPFEMSDDQLQEAIMQRMLHPRMLSITPAELAVDHALAHEALRLIMEQGASLGGVGELPHVDVIIGTGGILANSPRPGQAALMMLDAVQPRGVTSLVIDAAQVMTALGGASLLDRMAAADAVDMDAVQIQLGTCVSAVGAPPQGEPAVRAVLQYADGHRHTTEVLPGSIELLPLGMGQHARLLLYPSPGVDVGMGPGQPAQAGQPIEGGRLGVIIDARGRPLELPADAEQRLARLRQWQGAMGI
jgi:hypothetical protein